MTIKTFVGIGLNHLNDYTPLVARVLDALTPSFVTLEVPLNTNSFPCFPHSPHTADSTHEWSRIARVIIERGLSYYCIDGNLNPDIYPWFTDVDAAATTEFPSTHGKWGMYKVEYGAREYSVLGGKWHLLPQVCKEMGVMEISQRNEFAAAVLNRLAETREARCVVHVGGIRHFRWESDDKSNFVATPLQDLVDAQKRIIIDATLL